MTETVMLYHWIPASPLKKASKFFYRYLAEYKAQDRVLMREIRGGGVRECRKDEWLIGYFVFFLGLSIFCSLFKSYFKYF